jgi:hypothetical protein
MSKRVGKSVVVEATAPARCEDCQEVKELRPYGRDGRWVCFGCGMKDEINMREQFRKLFNGERDI